MESLDITLLAENIQQGLRETRDTGCGLRLSFRTTPRDDRTGEQIKGTALRLHLPRSAEAGMFSAPMSQNGQDAEGPLGYGIANRRRHVACPANTCNGDAFFQAGGGVSADSRRSKDCKSAWDRTTVRRSPAARQVCGVRARVLPSVAARPTGTKWRSAARVPMGWPASGESVVGTWTA